MTGSAEESFPDLSLAVHDIFVSCQFSKPTRAACMELVGADADFRDQAELIAVVETRAGVHHDSRTVHSGDETPCRGEVSGDNGIRVARSVAVDVVNSLVQVINHAHRNNRAEDIPPRSPAPWPARPGEPTGDSALVAADFDPAFR